MGSMLGSEVSSVTLSVALWADRHEHVGDSGQGFYVATRLGDFVAAPLQQGGEEEGDLPATYAETVKEEEEDTKEQECQAAGEASQAVASTTSTKSGEDTKQSKSDKSSESDYSSTEHSNDDSISMYDGATIQVADGDMSVELTAVSLDAVSNTPITEQKPPNATNTQVDSHKHNQTTIEEDILYSLVPECGIPIVPVIAKISKKKSKGMLLPWHSTRSMEYYRSGHRSARSSHGSSYRRSSSDAGSVGGRYPGLSTQRSSDTGIFFHSSVHTFRG